MVVAAIVGYLLGSIPTAQLVGRFYRVDPCERGDGNPGWWNMRGLVGERRAFIVLLGDLAKGAAAVVVGDLLWGPWWFAYVALGSALAGHAFPLFGRFRGGRGVLTFLGGMLIISPWAVALSVVVGLSSAVASRRFLYGARATIWSIPFAQLLFLPRAYVLVTLVLVAFVGLRFLFVRSLPAEPGEQQTLVLGTRR